MNWVRILNFHHSFGTSLKVKSAKLIRYGFLANTKPNIMIGNITITITIVTYVTTLTITLNYHTIIQPQKNLKRLEASM